ncbi:hypothetical protein BGZ63DRAFT_430201 [Mariannaea sp. PMI_226]|nr:hypothetical protein BGZ63DRAFT_430201 [Mariannaea sp. PMI_226]
MADDAERDLHVGQSTVQIIVVSSPESSSVSDAAVSSPEPEEQKPDEEEPEEEESEEEVAPTQRKQRVKRGPAAEGMEIASIPTPAKIPTPPKNSDGGVDKNRDAIWRAPIGILSIRGLDNVMQYLTDGDKASLLTNTYVRQDWMTVGMCIVLGSIPRKERSAAIDGYWDARENFQKAAQKEARARLKTRINLDTDLPTHNKETFPKPVPYARLIERFGGPESAAVNKLPEFKKKCARYRDSWTSEDAMELVPAGRGCVDEWIEGYETCKRLC